MVLKVQSSNQVSLDVLFQLIMWDSSDADPFRRKVNLSGVSSSVASSRSSFLDQKRIEKEKKDLLRKKDAAAKNIQRMFRGHICRKGSTTILSESIKRTIHQAFESVPHQKGVVHFSMLCKYGGVYGQRDSISFFGPFLDLYRQGQLDDGQSNGGQRNGGQRDDGQSLSLIHI